LALGLRFCAISMRQNSQIAARQRLFMNGPTNKGFWRYARDGLEGGEKIGGLPQPVKAGWVGGGSWGPAPKPPRKGMIPLRILIEFESRSSFAWTVFKLG